MLDYIDWEREGVWVVALTGRLALGQGNELLRLLVDTAVKKARTKVVLNLAEVVYIDSSGLGEIIASHHALQHAGGKLVLCNLSSRAQEMLQLTRVYLVVEIYPTEDAAVASLR